MSEKKREKRANGEGTKYFDKNKNRWIGEFRYKVNGKTQRKIFTDKSQTNLNKKMKEFMVKLYLNDPGTLPSTITFKDYAEHWMETVQKTKLKPTSFMRKVNTLKYYVYPFIGNVPIQDLRNNDIQNMVNKLSNELEFSYSSTKKAFEAVSSCMKHYRINERVNINPCEGVSLPTSKKKDLSDIKFFNEEQRKAIVKEAVRKNENGSNYYRFGYAIILLLYTGMRISELLALTWNDVDIVDKTILINKNAVVSNQDGSYKLINQTSTKTANGNRIIPLSVKALEAIKELKKISSDSKYVVSTKNNTQVLPGSINRTFQKILKNAPVPGIDKSYGVHTLRHTFATMLFESNCPIKLISDILGHSSTKVTENIYIHVIQKHRIMAIDNFDKYFD